VRVLGRASTLPLKYLAGILVHFLCCVSLPCVLECGSNGQQGSVRIGDERVDTHAVCVIPHFARTLSDYFSLSPGHTLLMCSRKMKSGVLARTLSGYFSLSPGHILLMCSRKM